MDRRMDLLFVNLNVESDEPAIFILSLNMCDIPSLKGYIYIYSYITIQQYLFCFNNLLCFSHLVRFAMILIPIFEGQIRKTITTLNVLHRNSLVSTSLLFNDTLIHLWRNWTKKNVANRNNLVNQALFSPEWSLLVFSPKKCYNNVNCFRFSKLK